jgi:glyoxylase-like metal-dependent hydrolase (beta-lactamase superfamily II)
MARVDLTQVSESCFAVVNARNRLCDASSGLVVRGGGLVVDTQADLAHARRMAELFGSLLTGRPGRVINTSESADHIGGNQLFDGAAVIAHRSVPSRMRQGRELADPRELLDTMSGLASSGALEAVPRGVRTAAAQLRQAYDFAGVHPTPPTMLFDDRLVLDLEGLEVRLIYVGPAVHVGDAIVHVPDENVVFAGDTVFRECAPLGWAGSSDQWMRSLDLIVWLDPEVIVPGHGPPCGVEGAMEMKAYLQYVCDEARISLGQGMDALEAAMRIELGPYRGWKCPARLYANVASAYRELEGAGAATPMDAARMFDAMYEVAMARGFPLEF